MTLSAQLARHGVRRSLICATAACLAVFTFSFILGYQAISSDWVVRENLGSGLDLDSGTWFSTTVEILERNVPVVILLYSGAATIGFGSIIPLFGIGAFVGATSRIGVEAASAMDVFAAVGPYLFLELGACVLSASAGAYPLVRTLLSRMRHDDSAIRSYIGALPMSLTMFAAALLLALFAGCIEAVVIIATD